MRIQSLKFFLLFCFLFFMSTLIATGKVLAPVNSMADRGYAAVKTTVRFPD